MARITGHLGSVYLGGVKVADTFDWTLEMEAAMAKASVKAPTTSTFDLWDRWIPGRGSARITANRFVQTTAVMSKEVADAVNNGEQLSFELHAIDASAGFQQVTGTGYVSRGTISAAHDAPITDVVEITVDGIMAFT